MSACWWRESGWELVFDRHYVRSQTFAKKNDSNAYFSEFLGANGRKIDLDHEIGVQMGVKRLFKPEFVIFICLLVRLNLTFG